MPHHIFLLQQLNPADLIPPKNDGGRPAQMEFEEASSNYAQIRVKKNKPPPPPTYDVHMQRGMKPAPQPDVAEQTSSQVRGEKVLRPGSKIIDTALLSPEFTELINELLLLVGIFTSLIEQ